MKRTTVMLPGDLHHRALRKARQRGILLGEVIRQSLEAALPPGSYDASSDPLFESVAFDGPAPRDLSARHDHYFYDDET